MLPEHRKVESIVSANNKNLQDIVKDIFDMNDVFYCDDNLCSQPFAEEVTCKDYLEGEEKATPVQEEHIQKLLNRWS